jgi:hypothetical protein
MLEVLISGKLIRDPQTRQGKSGQSFTTALVRVPVDKGEDSIVASVIAFQDATGELRRLWSFGDLARATKTELPAKKCRGPCGEISRCG